MFSSMVSAAAPLARRDGGEQAAAILGFLRTSLRQVSRGNLPPGLIPAPAGAGLETVGPSVPPPPQEEPPPGPGGPAPRPDLVVDSITGFHTQSFPLTLRVTVRNAGNATAPASKLALTMRRTYDGTQTSRELDVPSLAPGSSTTIETECYYGTDAATATADSPNAIAESDESNNTRSASGEPCRYN